MSKGFSYHLMICFLAVVVILLRPCCGNHTLVYGTTNKASDHFNSIQRVIKKNDSYTLEIDDILQLKEVKATLPFKRLNLPGYHVMLSSLPEMKISPQRNTVFQICPANHYYQLISRLRV